MFNGTVTHKISKITLTGLLSSIPELGPIYLVLVYLGTGVVASKLYISDTSNILTATIDTQEPLMGNEIPGICLMNPTSGKIFPVKFEKEEIGTDPT